MFDMERNVVSRLVSAAGITSNKMVWSRDGKHPFYHTDDGIFAVPIDGSREPQQIIKERAAASQGWKEEAIPIERGLEIVVSPDGRWLAYLSGLRTPRAAGSGRFRRTERGSRNGRRMAANCCSGISTGGSTSYLSPSPEKPSCRAS